MTPAQFDAAVDQLTEVILAQIHANILAMHRDVPFVDARDVEAEVIYEAELTCAQLRDQLRAQ